MNNNTFQVSHALTVHQRGNLFCVTTHNVPFRNCTPQLVEARAASEVNRRR